MKLFKKDKDYPAPLEALQGEIWVIQGARLGEKWSLEGGDLKVGRLMDDEEAAGERVISFPDHCKFISGQHAIFRKDSEGYWIYYLGSRNGTSVAGRRIEKAKLMDGDEVDVGSVVFKVKIHAPGQGAPLRTCALSVEKGPRSGERWQFQEGELLVGREIEGEQVVSFPGSESSISTEHAVFRRVKNGFWVQDKGSKNGTFVNGHRVESQELRDGDHVEVGSVTFLVRLSG